MRAALSHENFLAALLDPSLPAPSAVRHPLGERVEERFNIYRNNVIFSLRGALADKFPHLKSLIGDELFELLSDSYVRKNLPQTPILANYGDALPDLIAAFEPLQEVPYAADLTRLEIAWLACYHAADHTALAAEKLLIDGIADYRFVLPPSLRVVESDWPLWDIWAFTRDEGAPPQELAAQSVLVYRDVELLPQVARLPDGGAAFFTALQAGEALGAAAENTLSAEALQELMTLLVQNGQICKLNREEAKNV